MKSLQVVRVVGYWQDEGFDGLDMKTVDLGDGSRGNVEFFMSGEKLVSGHVFSPEVSGGFIVKKIYDSFDNELESAQSMSEFEFLMKSLDESGLCPEPYSKNADKLGYAKTPLSIEKRFGDECISIVDKHVGQDINLPFGYATVTTGSGVRHYWPSAQWDFNSEWAKRYIEVKGYFEEDGEKSTHSRRVNLKKERSRSLAKGGYMDDDFLVTAIFDETGEEVDSIQYKAETKPKHSLPSF